MSSVNTHRFTHPTGWSPWLFSLVCVLSMASVTRAQQPTSQVLTFTGSIPGQPDGPVAVRLRLYDASPGGTLRFEETQTVLVTSESFTVRIGDVTAGGVPATLFRNNPSLWIAFALDSTPDTEIGTRAAITSGGYAHAAAILAGPMVRTLNGLVGDVVLAEGSNVTITPSGNTLTIGATTGLTSVAHDGTLFGNGTGSAPLGVTAPLQLTSSGGNAISGISNNTGTGVFGSGGFGVFGSGSTGVYGTSSTGPGVRGDNTSNGGYGVYGSNSSAVGGIGVGGAGFYGVWGIGTGGATGGAGVRGDNLGGGGGIGVSGVGLYGVWGTGTGGGAGVRGDNTGGSYGVRGSGGGIGVSGSSPMLGVEGFGGGVGVYGTSNLVRHWDWGRV